MISSPTYRVQSRPGWTGRLLLSARPRGGDWLEDEVSAWKRESVDIVVSLLTPEEENELDLKKEANEVLLSGISSFMSFPIEDRKTPRSTEDFQNLAVSVDSALKDGKTVLVHCRQGIGRTGLVAASVLALSGMDIASATEHLSIIRGAPVPETIEQKRWLEQFSVSMPAGAR